MSDNLHTIHDRLEDILESLTSLGRQSMGCETSYPMSMLTLMKISLSLSSMMILPHFDKL